MSDHKKLVNILLALSEMQDSLNAAIDPQWKETGNPFYRAAWLELAEAMKHSDWPWWKSAEANTGEMITEYIDAIHFSLSALIVRYKSLTKEQFVSKLGEIVLKQKQSENELGGDMLRGIEIVVHEITKGKWSDKILTHVLQLCYNMGMSIDDIAKRYVAKNVLNMFRKNNGYKQGAYIKIWNGEEDNVVVLRIVSSATDFSNLLEQSKDLATEWLYDKLESYYADVENISAAENAAAYRG